MASPRIEQTRARFARVAFAEWLGATVAADLQLGCVDLSVQYLGRAGEEDVVAEARVSLPCSSASSDRKASTWSSSSRHRTPRRR